MVKVAATPLTPEGGDQGGVTEQQAADKQQGLHPETKLTLLSTSLKRFFSPKCFFKKNWILCVGLSP